MAGGIPQPVIIGRATLYLGDCRDVLESLEPADLVCTDPPYGIRMAKGVRGCGYDGFGNGIKRKTRTYEGSWDDKRPDADTFSAVLRAGKKHIIWGGNYFSDLLPMSQKWLFWDKLQTMPSFSDGELAWTNLDGASTKKFTYNGSGLMAKEQERVHPTQKPVQLMKWCIGFAPDSATVLDCFAGSGTTGIAAVQMGKQFIGIERDPAYFDIACRRIEDAQRQGDLLLSMESAA